MRLGILSDSHDRTERVEAALDLFRTHDVNRLIHCGDITSPKVVSQFAGWMIDFVLGNCDWDPVTLAAAIDAIGGTLHRPYGDLELDSVRVAWIHSDDADLFQSLEVADHYDWLFYGHTHVAEQHTTGRTRVVNPGALHRVKVPSVAVLDVPSGRLEVVPLVE
ncbi:MAG: YfcE family phosphodiesterase [Gemmataceae bacterium]|nr:YfcE family phosphodiesterase [Gemmataceae bacterium]